MYPICRWRRYYGYTKPNKTIKRWTRLEQLQAGISEGSLNNLLRLNNQPTIPTLEAICKGFDISLSQFFAEGNEAIVLNEEQKEMIDIWNTLNQEQKTALLELLKKM